MAEHENLYDAVVVGGGPAGLTAAIYLARARYRVLVLEKERIGGQIATTTEVVNYPGVALTSGENLTKTMKQQAESFGAEIKMGEVLSLSLDGDIKTVHTSSGDIEAFAVLIATGAAPRTIGFPGEAEFRGHGVAYCATCDGEFFTGKDIFVVGGGFAAAEESVFLTKYGKSVTILIRGDDFTCAPAAADEARNNEKITIRTNTEVVELTGDSMPRTLLMKNNQTGETELYEAPEGDTFGVFVLAGRAPSNELVRDFVNCNEQGYIVTDEHQRTSVEGVYAAGDVCIKSLRQVATAIGEAASAATEMERHISAMQAKTGIIPARPQPVRPAANQAPASAPASEAPAGELFSADAIAQLQVVFERMASPLKLSLTLDGRPISTELKGYADELAKLTDKLSVEVAETGSQDPEAPYVRVLSQDGTPTGLGFHGVPGGHEFNSFVLGLYNAAGPGQQLDDNLRERAEKLSDATKIQILVSLTCTMCPDTVLAAQRIASLNKNVSAEAYDLSHFPDLQSRYNVMSVPCVVINNGEKVSFGKKGISEMLELVE